MKLFATLIFLALCVSAHAECSDFTINSKACLHDTTYSYPQYSDGIEMNVGERACRVYEYGKLFEVVVTKKQGVEIALMLPKRVCREIAAIDTVKVRHTTKVIKGVDRHCCDLEWHSPSSRTMCYEYPKSSEAYRCRTYRDSVWYTKKFAITYSDSMDLVWDFESELLTHQVKQTPNAFVENDTLELYRDSGTLRYRGWVRIQDTLVVTKGYCYNEQGTKPTRKTNNADLCK